MVTTLIDTVRDEEIKQMFVSQKESRSLVTLEETTQKIIDVLESRKYKSGDRFDFYDPL